MLLSVPVVASAGFISFVFARRIELPSTIKRESRGSVCVTTAAADLENTAAVVCFLLTTSFVRPGCKCRSEDLMCGFVGASVSTLTPTLSLLDPPDPRTGLAREQLLQEQFR